MNLNNILNKPGDQPPPRRPRLSSSYSKESQSPADYRQGSVSVTTPISPYAPNSAHPGTPYGYPNPPNSALSGTPSSTASQGAFYPPSTTPTTYQPVTPLQHGPPPSLHSQSSSQYYQPHPPMYPPPSQPQHDDQYRQQSPPRLDQTHFRREQSQSVSPRTIHSRPSLQSQAMQSSEQPQPQPSQAQQPQPPPPPPIPFKRQESSAVSDREPSVPVGSVKDEQSVSTPTRWSEPRVESPAKATPTANSNNKRPLPDDSSPTTGTATTTTATTAAAPTQVKQEPQQKKRRVGEIPIWAQPAKNLKPLPKYTLNGATSSSSMSAATAARTATTPPPGQTQPKTQPNFGSSGPLGPFEETFRGDFVPQEELTKQVCDFLFRDVVLKQDLPTGEVGESAPVQGQLEIEAKIGTLIDKRTDERLALPISTETILRPNYPVAFESMMTETQHKNFNALLNEALKSSMGPPTTAQRDADPKPRIKMSYRHIYEVDTFYELPDEELSSLLPTLQLLVRQTPQHKPTLRVTRDKKTNEVKAKIVKTRISDMHVYSPSTSFDWRISVNFEADWDGDLDALMKSVGESNTKSNPDRHKDRMSYSHLFCKIDLTQVKGQSNKGPTTTHELEVELESKMVREQGKLVLNRSDNQYQELIKGFVDNVRILIRGVQ